MVTRRQIQALADDIAAKFDVEKVILFGSHAYGEPTEDSDVDLLVVMEFDGRSLDQAVKVIVATDPPFACDLILRTPAEALRRYQEFDLIERHAFDKGEVLHEREHSAVA